MIEKVIIDENIALLKTNKQFILIFYGEIWGPFKNEDAKKVYELLK